MKKEFIYIVIKDPEKEGENCLARIHATKIENGVYIHKFFDSNLKECKPWIITDYSTGREIVRGNTKSEALANFEDKRLAYVAIKMTKIYERCLKEFQELATKRIVEVRE